MNLLVFDIETVPDLESARRLFDLQDLPEREVIAFLKEKKGEFLPPHWHRIVAIAVLYRGAGREGKEVLTLRALGQPDDPEKELIASFFKIIDRYTPVLVSWNGSGFDLPVLHYRALLYAIPAPRYWEVGDGDATFRSNHYLGRYHWRHIDLMDVLSGYQPRGWAPLDEVARMAGLPGKLGLSGEEVCLSWLEGEIEKIRNYCEIDVLNTYLLYLRFEKMRGRLRGERFEQAIRQLDRMLLEEGSRRSHLSIFRELWRRSDLSLQSHDGG